MFFSICWGPWDTCKAAQARLPSELPPCPMGNSQIRVTQRLQHPTASPVLGWAQSQISQSAALSGSPAKERNVLRRLAGPLQSLQAALLRHLLPSLGASHLREEKSFSLGTPSPSHKASQH